MSDFYQKIIILSLVFLPAIAVHGQGFVTTWQTTTPNEQITIPTIGVGYNYTVNWGDGSIDTNVTGNTSHTYASAGNHTVTITGDFPRIYFNDVAVDKDKILEINQWGAIAWTSMEGAFHGCTNLTVPATDAPDLIGVVSMISMFEKCGAFNEPVNHWDVSNITDMTGLFRGASSFNQPLDNWDVGNVRLMDWMFNAASSFNQDIGGWNVGNVTNMQHMFHEAGSFNRNIGGWNVGNVTNMQHMFHGAILFNQDIGGWNVRNVTEMQSMFQNATIFNQNLEAWDMSNVVAMNSMFAFARFFNQPLNGWNVSNVTDMGGMFSNARDFNQDIGAWNVSNVTEMGGMFASARGFNQDIEAWNVSNVTNMGNMFSSASDFNQPLNAWDVSLVTNMDNMFEDASSFNQYLGSWTSNAINRNNMFINSGMDCNNYSATLVGWETNTSANNVILDADGLQYSTNVADVVNELVNNRSWTINGHTPSAGECRLFEIDAIANANVNENAAYTSVTPNLSGGTPIGNVIYSISGGADAADFTINATTGVVSMVGRDFESPADANTDNVYEIEITATDDDNNSDTETWTVTVNDQIEVANFTIDAIANANINENAVYTSVTPNLSGDTPIGNVTYTISGGADAADFTINGTTGVVSMVARDFESPVDANTDNIYEIEITAADDDNNSDTETWTVTVNDQIEVANFTIDAIANANVNENAAYTSVTPNLSGGTPIGNVIYSISGGADAADFTINATTGVVSMVGRDFESPADANTDNVYEIEITATDDDNNSDTETWTVTVIDDVTDNFSPPTGLSLSNQQINENEPAGTFIGILSAQDPDIGDSHTFSLLGTNASLFTIQDDSLKAAGPFNFEQRNAYNLTIQVEDAKGLTFSNQFEILVLNVNESPTEIILSNNTVNEEDIVIDVGILSTVDEDAADTHNYTILAGDHSSFFDIVDDRLITDESLVSNDGTQYIISVQSEDSQGLTITRDFVITVVRKVHNEFNFPNAFTPNGDQENDTWEIPFLDLVDDCKVLIMDRNGNVVFKSIGYDTPWDGSYGGNKLPKGTYFYIIQESRQGENKIHKGYVVIL